MLSQKFRNKILDFWEWWKGDLENFTYESRLFHVFSFIIIIAAVVTLQVNIFINLQLSSIIAFLVFFFHSLFYYLSRFKKQQNLAIKLSVIEINILLSINYFFNSGLVGPTFLLLLVYLFLILSLSNKKSFLVILISNIGMVMLLMGLEYFFPHLVLGPPPERADFFADILLTYIIVAVLFYIGTISLRNSYYKQKLLADEKAISLQKINEEKNKLFSVISHDLRSPLYNIQQYLELLSEIELSKEDKEKFEKDLLVITRDTQDLLTNLLHWSKNQMGGKKINVKQIKLKQAISKSIELAITSASRKKIDLIVDIDKDLEITADDDMLNLIIRNLLNNAIKFTNKHGCIKVSAKAENDDILIKVEDNGVGISEAKKEKLFSLKAESSFGTDNEKGTGLGLILCKDYTEIQGGKIWFESEEGSGTSFYLSFPILKT